METVKTWFEGQYFSNYKYMYRKYISNGLGKKKLSSINYSDIKKLYHSLIDEKGFKPNSMEVINTILHPIFETAVRDDYIRKNPTKGVMNEIKSRRDWDKPKRKALTEEQQAAFIDYVANSRVYRHWMTVFTVLLGTGCRVGEIIGLRWKDCDFENNLISINHNLIYRQQDNGKCEFHITTPKTKAGVRSVPMFDEVKEALITEYNYQKLEGYNRTVIDGYSGFIFKNRFGDVLSAHCIYKEYNAEETKTAQAEGRPPLIIPHFTVHNLRHTFCTRLCENQSNEVTLKVIQEIMGHADISTTLDVYTDLTTQKKQQAFGCLQGKIKLT